MARIISKRPDIPLFGATTVSGSGTVAPASADTTPDQFTFVDQSDVAVGATITSAPITVQGLGLGVQVTASVANGLHSLNGGAFTSSPFLVQNGNQVRLQRAASGSNSTAVTATETIGGVQDTWIITTVAASGALVHGSTFTVTGTGMADQSAATQIWDDCTTGTFGSNGKWSGGWPTGSNAASNIGYRSPNGTIALPHPNVTRYLSGAHYDGGNGVGFNSGYNVAGWRTFTRPAFPFWTVLSWYERCDTRWTNRDVGAAPLNYQNWKWYGYSVNNDIYGSQSGAQLHYYMGGTSEPSGDFQNGGGPFDGTLNDDSDLGFDGLQTQTVYGGSQANPCTDWVKKWVITKHSNLSNQGRIIVKANNNTQIDYTGFNDQWPGTTRSIGFGGYSTGYSFVNNIRYFSDMGLTISPVNGSPGRIELTNNANYASSTIKELQPYVTTSSTSWLCTCNKGKLSAGTVHAHYVDELNGNQYLGTKTMT